MNAAIDQLKFDSAGLIPIIVQDADNGHILMMAWMNREALLKTLQTGRIHTYSRSRGRIALKGETSGHFQLVREILADCDMDALVFRCEQIVAACHEGYRSCFFRRYDAASGQWRVIAAKVFDEKAVYGKPHP